MAAPIYIPTMFASWMWILFPNKIIDPWSVSVQALEDLEQYQKHPVFVTPTGKVVCVWKEMFQVILSLQAPKSPTN